MRKTCFVGRELSKNVGNVKMKQKGIRNDNDEDQDDVLPERSGSQKDVGCPKEQARYDSFSRGREEDMGAGGLESEGQVLTPTRFL